MVAKERAGQDDRVFAPRRTKVVALTLAATVALLTLVTIVLPPVGFTVWDRAAMVVLAAPIVWFLWRQSSVRAVPSAQGLHVRNLIKERQLEWAEIVHVRFGDRPWVQLDLDDGDTIAVMGIQRSDGERAVAESRRLATLVERHSMPGR